MATPSASSSSAAPVQEQQQEQGPATPVVLANVTTFAVNSKALENKCLDIPQGKAGDGALVQLWACNGEQAQNFFFTPSADNAASGSVHAVLRGGTAQAPTDLCLDAPTATDGVARMQLANCNGSARQNFTKLFPNDDTQSADTVIGLQNGDKCLTATTAEGQIVNGNPGLVLGACEATEYNRFRAVSKPV